MPRSRFTRRAVLRAGATGLVGGVAGCSGLSGTRADSAAGASTPTEREPLRLDTYEVAGSPGTTMRVRPPGTVVLLDFWATWCAPCKRQMPVLRQIREQFPAVHMLSITNETDETAIKTFWRTHQGTWPVASDPTLETNARYDVRTVSTLVIFDPDGQQVWRDSGFTGTDTIATHLRAASK